MEKVLIIGYGSIGRRHAIVLRKLGFDVAFFRSGKSTLIKNDKNSLGLNVYFNLDEAVEKFKPKYAVDCSPSSLHLKNIFKLYSYRINTLIEKPLIINDPNSVDLINLRKILDKKDYFVGIGFQYRFHPLINKLKNIYENLKDKNIIIGNVTWTEYLPDWHTWENYKDSYSARRELGGGCLLTLCHPFDYLHYIFNEASFKKTIPIEGRLEIKVNQTIKSYFSSNKIKDLNLYLDFDSKIKRHTINIEGKDWSIFSNLNNGYLHMKSSNAESININLGTIDRNDQFRDMHLEYYNWINGQGDFRSKLKDHLELAIYLSKENKKFYLE